LSDHTERDFIQGMTETESTGAVADAFLSLWGREEIIALWTRPEQESTGDMVVFVRQSTSLEDFLFHGSLANTCMRQTKG